MSKTIYITTEQLRYFSELSEKEGKCIVKHLPESSAFKPKKSLHFELALSVDVGSHRNLFLKPVFEESIVLRIKGPVK